MGSFPGSFVAAKYGLSILAVVSSCLSDSFCISFVSSSSSSFSAGLLFFSLCSFACCISCVFGSYSRSSVSKIWSCGSSALRYGGNDGWQAITERIVFKTFTMLNIECLRTRERVCFVIVEQVVDLTGFCEEFR